MKVEKREVSEPLQRYYDLVTGAVLGSDTEALKVRHIINRVQFSRRRITVVALMTNDCSLEKDLNNMQKKMCFGWDKDRRCTLTFMHL